ncbi:MAG: type III secretion system export apparatus subunit SctU [Planctomycetaceae bacterium]|nr:type III secretion system export apparatus subunit SctU [Planctomycetaceae bacterium]
MSGEKTEQPTSKKLRDARKKGQVAQSRDVTSTALLIAMCAYLAIGWNWIVAQLQWLISYPGELYGLPFEESLPRMLGAAISTMAAISLPALAIIIVVGVMAGYFQVGALFVFEPVKPDLKKLNPADKLKQMFSLKNFMEFLKSNVKVVFLGVLLYIVIKNAIPELLKIPYSGLDGVSAMLGSLMLDVAIFTGFAYVLIAGADFAFQRWQHTKGLMMTKDEVKREYKEMEGDPTIKGKRRQLHQELVMQDTIAKVRKSTVLVTNPTHRAIAIYYEDGETKLPIITAKGEGFLAQRMVKAAQEEGIPIMQNVPLAHDLFDNGQIEHYIPRDLIRPVAEVLRWVRELAQERERQLRGEGP